MAMSTNADPINDLLKQLEGASSGSVKGQDQITSLQSKLSASLASLISTAVTGNAAATRGSAETTAKSAKAIVEGLEQFTKTFAQATQELKIASGQTATAARRLNAFTLVLAVGTLMMFGSGCWQAWEAKRQADLAERALQKPQPVIVSPPPSNLPQKQ